MTIYVTTFNPVTKEATEPSRNSGFTSLADVKSLMGKPLHDAPKTLTYETTFYSNFPIKI